MGLSRLTEIIENNKQLDQLFSLIRHYGMSAEFVTDALIKQLEQANEAEGEIAEEDKQYSLDMIDDLKQYSATF